MEIVKSVAIILFMRMMDLTTEVPAKSGNLFRPSSPEEAREIVNEYAADEPSILRDDFYHSLLAAFTPREVEDQLVSAGLTELSVKKISDRHLLVVGTKK